MTIQLATTPNVCAMQTAVNSKKTTTVIGCHNRCFMLQSNAIAALSVLLRLLCPGVEQLKQYYAEVDVILQNIEHTTVPLLVIFKVIGRDGIGTSCNQEQRERPHKIYYNRCLRGLHQIPPPPAPPSSTTRPAVPSPPSTHDHRRSGGLPGHPSKPAGCRIPQTQ